MFERLVVVGAEGEPTRRRVARTELAGVAGSSVDATIDRWAQARLLTLDRHPQTRVPTVELAHEALLREWPRLRRWIEEDREAIMVLGHLREAAASWVELGRDPGALYRGARLEVALDVADGRVDELPEPEREFLDASRDDRDREQQEEAERVARQARANRRLRIQLAAIAVALVVALVGGFIALDQRRRRRAGAPGGDRPRARRGRRSQPRRRSRAQHPAGVGGDRRDPIQRRIGPARGRGSPAPRRDRFARPAQRPGCGRRTRLEPGRDIFVTEGPEDSGPIDIRDAETGDSVLSFHGHDVDVNDVAFSSDGSMLATTGDDGAVRVWDPTTGEELSSSRSRTGPAWSWAVVQPRRIPAGGVVGPRRRGPSDRPSPPATPSPRSSAHRVGTAFSPDGQRIALGSSTCRTDRPGRRRRLGRAAVHARRATRDRQLQRGARTAGGSPPRATTRRSRIWDAETGEHRFTMTGHTARVDGLDWSPDSTRLATGSDDGTARISEITEDGTRELFSFSAQDTSQGLNGVAFSPDGERLMTGDAAITAVKIWDASTTGGAELANVPAEFFGLPYAAVDFTPDSRACW